MPRNLRPWLGPAIRGPLVSFAHGANTIEELRCPRCGVGVHFLQEDTGEVCAMPGCRSPKAFLNAFDLAALHYVASDNASMVRPDHLETLARMGLVVGMNGRTALTVEGLHVLGQQHGAQRADR
jgi:hypothetical protein